MADIRKFTIGKGNPNPPQQHQINIPKELLESTPFVHCITCKNTEFIEHTRIKYISELVAGQELMVAQKIPVCVKCGREHNKEEFQKYLEDQGKPKLVHDGDAKNKADPP